MTFENTAWAINGALLGSSLARRAEYAAVSGAEGTVQKADLAVTQLGTPGIGVLIAAGVGLVRNKYQTVPNETYVVSNPGTHTIPSIEMPASNPSPKSYILAVIVGDPDFSQTGHPFMGSDDPPIGEEESFEYVRAMLIEVSPGATELTGTFPALVLARIDIPASTTTIINSYIVDLRHLARPQQSQEIFASASGTWTNGSPERIATGAAYTNWGNPAFIPSVDVPEWATRAILVCSINGVRLADTSASVSGGIRAELGGVTGPAITFDYSVGGGAIRDNLQAAGEYNVTSIAGTSAALRVEGFENVPASPSTAQRLALQAGSQIVFDVRFFEE